MHTLCPRSVCSVRLTRHGRCVCSVCVSVCVSVCAFSRGGVAVGTHWAEAGASSMS